MRTWLRRVVQQTRLAGWRKQGFRRKSTRKILRNISQYQRMEQTKVGKHVSHHQLIKTSLGATALVSEKVNADDKDDVEEFLQTSAYTRALSTLTEYELDSIALYRGTQDYKRNPHIQAAIATALAKMPPLTKRIVLFRGQKWNEFHSNTWMSTSTSVGIALNFSSENCCLYALTIMPPVRVLPIFTIGKRDPVGVGELQSFMAEHEVIIDCGILDLREEIFLDISDRKNGLRSVKTYNAFYRYAPNCAENSDYLAIGHNDFLPTKFREKYLSDEAVSAQPIPTRPKTISEALSYAISDTTTAFLETAKSLFTESVDSFLQSAGYREALHSLSEHELDAIQIYRYDPAFKRNARVNAAITSALSKMPALTRSIVLFRGQIGPFHTDTWFSTSTAKDVARKFGKLTCCVYALTVVPPVSVLPLLSIPPRDVWRRGDFTSYAPEREVIVECGTLGVREVTYLILPTGDGRIVPVKTFNAYYRYLPYCAENSEYVMDLPDDRLPKHFLEYELRRDAMKVIEIEE